MNKISNYDSQINDENKEHHQQQRALAMPRPIQSLGALPEEWRETDSWGGALEIIY